MPTSEIQMHGKSDEGWIVVPSGGRKSGVTYGPFNRQQAIEFIKTISDQSRRYYAYNAHDLPNWWNT